MASSARTWHHSGMTSITIDLPPELHRIVRDHVESGLYADAADVGREALRRMDADEAATQADLRAVLAAALADLDAGRILDETILDVVDAEDARLR